MPSGTILPWWGDMSSIPSGFLLCDGTNGTPNLTGRTLIGSGIWSDSYGAITYTLGSTSGERMHQLSVAEMPTHNHELHFNYETDNTVDGSGTVDNRNIRNSLIANSIATTYAGGNYPHNNMMPYMVVHWIIKI